MLFVVRTKHKHGKIYIRKVTRHIWRCFTTSGTLGLFPT